MFHKGGEGRPRGFGFGSFAVSAKKPEPQLGRSAFQPETTPVPALPVVNRHGYTGLSTITQNALDINYGNLRKRPKTEEERISTPESLGSTLTKNAELISKVQDRSATIPEGPVADRPIPV